MEANEGADGRVHPNLGLADGAFVRFALAVKLVDELQHAGLMALEGARAGLDPFVAVGGLFVGQTDEAAAGGEGLGHHD